ncbi:hypothetical protein IWQ57_006145 [Coemansia nantahalensis]|uniref:Uncharacterized protein n=1 Tax=Coemansia nantahalensis TaxID=2789366 RepID=A0ACC1JKT6_9FUNG|nr:hypothetical protein IWQ57_006145 [Coemansia nantahalensis]
MCRELDTQIYQLRLMLARFHADLNAMVDQYNILAGADDDSQVSTKADWEEVMEMANRPADAAASRARPVPSTHNNSSSTTVAADSSACGSQPHSASHASPMSGTTASPSPSAEQKPKATQHAPFPWCSTPPMEEVVELRQHLREIEQSPLFTDSPPLHRLHRQAPLLPVQQRTPSSLP